MWLYAASKQTVYLLIFFSNGRTVSAIQNKKKLPFRGSLLIFLFLDYQSDALFLFSIIRSTEILPAPKAISSK